MTVAVLETTKKWLASCLRRAKEEKALLGQQPAAIGELGFAAIAGMMVRAAAGLVTIPASQLGSASKAIAETVERMQGGDMRPARTRVTFMLPDQVLMPDGELVNAAEVD